MKKITTLVHWLSYAYYVYVFGYASLFKVFRKESMMTSMQSLGFNTAWTTAIGLMELLGLLTVVAGLWKPLLKNAGILFLAPFAVGAFTAHMAHQEYHHYFNSLAMCVLTVVLLYTDRHFKIVLQ